MQCLSLRLHSQHQVTISIFRKEESCKMSHPPPIHPGYVAQPPVPDPLDPGFEIWSLQARSRARNSTLLLPSRRHLRGLADTSFLNSIVESGTEPKVSPPQLLIRFRTQRSGSHHRRMGTTACSHHWTMGTTACSQHCRMGTTACSRHYRIEITACSLIRTAGEEL